MKYIFREDGEIVPCTLMQWAEWIERDRLGRLIDQTEIPGYWISTVFLGIDYGFGGPPLFFESMVFRKEGEQRGGEAEQRRYTTAAEARRGHKDLIKLWTKRGPDWSEDGN